MSSSQASPSRPLSITHHMLAFLIVGLAGIFLVYEFVLQISPSVMTDEFMHAFKIDAFTLGAAMAYYYYTYAPMQVVAGLSFDRLGARATLTSAAVLCAIGTALIASNDSVYMLKLGRAFTGIGSACAYIGVLFLGKRWFAAKYFYLVVGVTQFLGCMGAVGGEGPTASLVEWLGWRDTLYYLAITGGFIALLILLLVKDQPTEKVSPEADYPEPEQNVFQNLLKTIRRKHTWTTGLYAFTVFAPMAAFAALWGVPFLKVTYNISAAKAAGAVSLIWISNGIFSCVAGWISERYHSRKWPLASTALFGVFLSLVIIYIPVSFNMMMVLMFLFGIATAGQSLTFNVVNDNTPSYRSGTAMGFNNMLIVLTGATMQPLVGMLIHQRWDGTMLNGIPQYTAANYQHALVVLPIAFTMAFFICVFLMKETHCQPSYGAHE